MFYVYVYLDPRKPGLFKYGEYEFGYEPIYVGKGQGERLEEHWLYAKKGILREGNRHKFNKLRKIMKEGLEPIIFRYKNNLEEDVSFLLETKMITTIGRNDKKEGPLVNMTDGGEGLSGYVYSKKQREENSKRLKQYYKENPFSEELKKKLSDFWTEEMREERSKQMKDLWKKRPHSMLGKTHSEETRTKISDALKISMKGEGNSFYGKHHTEETKQKLREKNSGENHVFAAEYILIHPDGKREEIKCLRKLCRGRGFNRGVLRDTIKSGKPISKGKNKGYRLERL